MLAVRIALRLICSLAFLLAAMGEADAQRARTKQGPRLGKVTYGETKIAEYREIRELFRKERVLERFQRFFSAMRTPRPINYRLSDCEGEVEAWYDPDDRTITVCYEYIADILKHAPGAPTEDGITSSDVVFGSVVEVFLHEAGHAFFDIFKIPILGREEDAADQLAAYVLLQFGDDIALRTIRGVGYMYATEARASTPGMKAFANEHSLPAQRFFNLACMAFGAKPAVFGFVVKKDYLPRERAERCEEEYRQVAYALSRLLGPHLNKRAADRLQATIKGWTRPTRRR